VTARKVIVCTGGRDYSDAATVAAALRLIDPDEVHVGDAKGADYLVSRWASDCPSLGYFCHVANWTKHGKSAGPIRNGHMLAAAQSRGARQLLRFPGGPGTADCVRQAEALGFEIIDAEALVRRGSSDK
jgi:hypothetical protein